MVFHLMSTEKYFLKVPYFHNMKIVQTLSYLSNFLKLFLRSNSCCIGKSKLKLEKMIGVYKSIGKKLKFKQFQFSSPLINQILSETQKTTERTWLLESKLILNDSEQL